MSEKAKILVVEDSRVAVRYIKKALNSEYDIDDIASGEEALEYLKKSEPDLILLDVTLPGISGFDVCREISGKKEYSNLPVIMVTASADASHVKEGIEAGAVDYVQKPFSEIELKARIDSALKLRHYIQMLHKANDEKAELISQLEKSLSEVKTLSGLLPICSNCKKVRDDKGYWNEVESYIGEHADVEFTHGICPPCKKLLYPQLASSQD